MNAFLKVLLSSIAGAALSGGAQAVQSGHVDLTSAAGWATVGYGAAATAMVTALAHLAPSPLQQTPNAPLVSSAAAAVKQSDPQQ